MSRKAVWKDESPVNTMRGTMEGPLSQPSNQAGLPADNRPVWFMNGVLNRLTMCDVYFKLTEASPSTFQFEVLAIADVAGQRFSATMRTAQISRGASLDKVHGEIDDISNGMAKILGVRIFNGKAQPIPEAALRIFEAPA
jgi:hypothetical protein